MSKRTGQGCSAGRQACDAWRRRFGACENEAGHKGPHEAGGICQSNAAWGTREQFEEFGQDFGPLVPTAPAN